MMGGVADYYDRNTRGFLRFGQGGDLGAIHRAVWAPDVPDRRAAFRYVDDRLLELVERIEGDATPTVVDLGCGTGASLAYLAERRNLRGAGVTISPVQVELAARRFEQAGLSDRVRAVEADFTALPDDVGPADLAYGIESFVHGSQPLAFFEQAARLVRPGGLLVVCDDFLTTRGTRPDLASTNARFIHDFRRGWHLPSLASVEDVDRMATSHGFALEDNENWTPWLELRRPRDRLIAGFVRLGSRFPIRHPWWQNLVGGDAGQKAILAGLVEYRFVVWRRRAYPPRTRATTLS